MSEQYPLRTFTYEPLLMNFPNELYSIECGPTVLSICTVHLYGLKQANLLYANFIRSEMYHMRTYPMRTLACAHLLTYFFPYEPCV